MKDIEKIITEITNLKRKIIVDYEKYSDRVWSADDSFNNILHQLEKIKIAKEKYEIENACTNDEKTANEKQNTKYHSLYEKK